MTAEGIPDPAAFLGRDGLSRKIHVFEIDVELNGIEIQSADALSRFFQRIRKIAREYSHLYHVERGLKRLSKRMKNGKTSRVLPEVGRGHWVVTCGGTYRASTSAKLTARCSRAER